MENEAISITHKSVAEATVLIVDDEPSICRTLENVLVDEGFQCLVAVDGASALELVKSHSPSLVLLDIWMPGLDGLETLQQIREINPSLPVIMMSGHATIATAVQATKMGAKDFIEKPLDLDRTINSVRRALEPHVVGSADEQGGSSLSGPQEQLHLGRVWDSADINPIVFRSQLLPGKSYTQKTLARSALLYGQGLHSGKKSGLVLEPLPPSSGIHFVGVSGAAIIPAHVDFVESTGFATTIRAGQTQVATVEHLLSALHAFGITNLLVKCNDEVPVLDGSSLEFCNLIEETGIEDQEGEWFAIKVNETVRVGTGDEYIQIEPAEEFSVEYTLRYPEPVGQQKMTFTFGNVEEYKREIASARTFGFVKDVGALQSQGLAQGGRFDNFVLYGEEGAINAELRFPDEAVRHKILDAVGDLYLLGRPLQGKVTACMTGHSDNIQLLRAIKVLMERRKS